MKGFFFKISLLYIYILFLGKSYSQNLNLNIQGKDSLETSIIKNLNHQKTFPNYRQLKDEVDTLKNAITKMGFIEAELIDLKKTNDSNYHALLHLNQLYKKIRINNPDEFYQAGLNKNDLLSVASVVNNDFVDFDFPKIEKSLVFLNKKIAETGYPFVTLRLTKMTPSKESTSLLESVVEITQASQRYITGIEIKGYEQFPKSFLKHTIGIKKGNLFQLQKIIDKSFLINHLGFAKNIKEPEVLFRPNETILYLYIEKAKANTFDGIIGFATNEDTDKLEFNGFVNLNLINNLNFGESLYLEYRNDGQSQESFNINTELPYLFSSPFGLEAGLSFFKQDSTFLNVEKNSYLNYKLNYKTKVVAGYKNYTSENLLDNENSNVLIQDFSSNSFVFGLNYISLQNKELFPIKTYIDIKNDIGEKKQNKITTPLYKINLESSHIFNLNQTNSIFIKNNTSYIQSENVLENELVRFGGIKAMRGFNENSIYATFFSVLSTEYRYQSAPNLYLHSIIDLAHVENSITRLKTQLYSFGFGIGLQTQAGMLNLNIANGKTKEQNFNFSNTKIHLSLSTKF